jgi:hypothetical protein
MRSLENRGRKKVGSGLAKTVTFNSYSVVKRRSVPVIWMMIRTEAGLSCRQPVQAKLVLSKLYCLIEYGVHNEKYRIDMGIGSVQTTQPNLDSRPGVNVPSDVRELSIVRAMEEAPGLALKYILLSKDQD